MNAETMATKKKTGTEDEGRQLNIRISGEDFARLEKFASLLPVTAVARAAMLLGLDMIEKRPSLLAEGIPTKRER